MARGIRVALVHGPGPAHRDGVGDYVERLVGALGGAGVDAVGVPVGTPDTRSPRQWLPATLEAARRVRRLRPDVVHVQFAPSAYRFSGLPGLLPPLLPAGTPLVTTLHEYGWWATPGWVPDAVWWPLERARLWDRETGRLVPASALVVVTNASHARQVHGRLGTPAVEVPLAPNVVDHGGGARARARVRRELGVRPGDPLLAFFGFVHPVKGVRQLVEALPALRTGRPGLRLLVVGGFTSQALPEAEARAFRAEVEALAARHGVADTVTFTGHLPASRVSELLHAADAGVLPFTAGVTTKSGALLTMLAHGLPVAVTVPDEPDPALPLGEAVAVIRARRDAAAVARAVGALLDDPDLRRRMGGAARRLAARHSWPEVATAHRALYETLTGPRPGLPRRLQTLCEALTGPRGDLLRRLRSSYEAAPGPRRDLPGRDG
ncbi:glycosyltransferase family 4 protein [Microbispora triticiradicis]|uniref:glycosyltransferase family 4 protein n=1 Tax=Microbispora triticiradicis TaxID=2200763 RepID=UPI001AD6D0A2|nr:glycosyltransferase family 4 protein [Microbispora triticiradicis]MBO4274558.1 glycosyltransferase [Microbispora triticiradicis]